MAIEIMGAVAVILIAGFGTAILLRLLRKAGITLAEHETPRDPDEE